MARVPDLLSSARVAITHIRGQRGRIYRARLLDMSEGQARKACQRLTSLKNDCLVIQDPDRVKLAQSAAN